MLPHRSCNQLDVVALGSAMNSLSRARFTLDRAVHPDSKAAFEESRRVGERRIKTAIAAVVPGAILIVISSVALA
jgi:hypothetical protein